MPRAYYKPFTAYEEAIGFRGTRRNAYLLCGLFFGALLFKIMLLLKYSSVNTPPLDTKIESDPRYQAMLQGRTELADAFATQDSMAKALRSRKGAIPPA